MTEGFPARAKFCQDENKLIVNLSEEIKSKKLSKEYYVNISEDGVITLVPKEENILGENPTFGMYCSEDEWEDWVPEGREEI